MYFMPNLLRDKSKKVKRKDHYRSNEIMYLEDRIAQLEQRMSKIEKKMRSTEETVENSFDDVLAREGYEYTPLSSKQYNEVIKAARNGNL